jgi:hypothetical protein
MAWGASLPRVGPNQFKDLGTGTIAFGSSDGVMEATLMTDGGTFFAGKRIDEPHLGDADLAVYTGQYRSVELDVTYNLSISQGNLLLQNNHSRWNPPLKLSPVAQDEFEGPEFNIVFRRDADHRVCGLSVFSIRARNISFEKVN